MQASGTLLILEVSVLVFFNQIKIPVRNIFSFCSGTGFLGFSARNRT